MNNMRPRKSSEDHENLERWLLTYADLITLLLAFFIVMYSMSQVDAKKFGKMSKALSGVLKGGEAIAELGDDVGTAPGKGVLNIGQLMSVGRNINEKFEKLLKFENKSENEGKVTTEITERGLVIHVMESALFKSGSAILEDQAISTLDIVASEINGLPNHIRIEGHTDNIPIVTGKYPSNWELSSARATEVVRYLIDNYGIPPTQISALGYGEFRPVKPNNNFENRAQNRRVDIVVLTMEITMSEPTSQFYQ
ncbi:MAG: flagellar motor protein MotB [Candidatus Zixiibacteriota bacterium]